MIEAAPILPDTGRGTIRRMVEGIRVLTQRSGGARAPSTPRFAGGPPPRTGED